LIDRQAQSTTAAQRWSKTCDDMNLDRRFNQPDAAAEWAVDAAQDNHQGAALRTSQR
jgi:hypothetical protein